MVYFYFNFNQIVIVILHLHVNHFEKLPFVGLVENFNESLQKLESWLIDEGFEGINIAPKVQNVSRDTSKSIDEKVAEIRDEIGEEAFEFLVQNNQDDFELYELAKQKFSE